MAGVLSDRLGDRWPVVRGSLLLTAGGFLVLALLGSVGAVPAGVAAVSLGAAALAATLAAIVPMSTPMIVRTPSKAFMAK